VQTALIKGNRNYDLEIAGGFLMHLSDFDKEMNQVVVESGILKGAQLACGRAAGGTAAAGGAAGRARAGAAVGCSQQCCRVRLAG
jgi:hypothetical protein